MHGSTPLRGRASQNASRAGAGKRGSFGGRTGHCTSSSWMGQTSPPCTGSLTWAEGESPGQGLGQPSKGSTGSRCRGWRRPKSQRPSRRGQWTRSRPSDASTSCAALHNFAQEIMNKGHKRIREAGEGGRGLESGKQGRGRKTTRLTTESKGRGRSRERERSEERKTENRRGMATGHLDEPSHANANGA